MVNSFKYYLTIMNIFDNNNNNNNIGMEFGIEKCVLLVMKSSKRHMTEGVELLNQVVIRTLAKKETYK